MAEPDVDVLEAPYDANDPKAVENAKRRASRVAKEDMEVIRKLLSTREGRSWIWRKMADAAVFGNPVGSDPYTTYFNLGVQSFGKMLLAETQRHPDLYAVMATENAK